MLYFGLSYFEHDQKFISKNRVKEGKYIKVNAESAIEQNDEYIVQEVAYICKEYISQTQRQIERHKCYVQ